MERKVRVQGQWVRQKRSQEVMRASKRHQSDDECGKRERER
jgi:hypothetical protein